MAFDKIEAPHFRFSCSVTDLLDLDEINLITQRGSRWSTADFRRHGPKAVIFMKTCGPDGSTTSSDHVCCLIQ